MNFELEQIHTDWLVEAYERAMKECGEFFGFDWTKNRPHVYLVPDRKTINSLREEETPDWVVGWGGRQSGAIYLLKFEAFGTESVKKYSKEEYIALMKHELAHCFYDVLTGSFRQPKWLCEGVAIFVSGQLKWRKEPKKYQLSFEGDQPVKVIYGESGYVVKKLVNEYGKEKLLELLNTLKEQRPETGAFATLFNKIYGIKLEEILNL